MKNVILIILSIIVVLYIIDRKPVKTLAMKNELMNNLTPRNYIELFTENILNYVKEINPLKTDYVWTYIEIYRPSKNKINLYENNAVIPYFLECIKKMNESIIDLVILTPLNIRLYLPNFDLNMSPLSPIPLKKRIDILYSKIIKTYGGLCISPGTIVYNIQPILNKTSSYDLVTVGSSDTIMNNYDNKLYPNNYIIGGRKNSEFMNEYSIKLYQTTLEKRDVKHLDTTTILEKCIDLFKLNNDNHYHFNIDHDGSYDNNLKKLTLEDYLGTTEIKFKNPEKLYLVTFPYDKLSLTLDYKWFLYMKKDDFNKSNLEIKRLLNT